MNIVSAIKNSDEFVFQQVFNQYHEKLYFFILSKTKSAYLAEEVVQITFIKLWNTRERLNEEFSISTQIFRIGTTTLIDLLRKQNNSLSLIKELQKQYPDYSTNSTVEKMDAAAVDQMLAKGLKNMPPVRKKVFEMSRLQGLSHKEIAQKMLISPKTVEIHITKALKQLKDLFIIFCLVLATIIGVLIGASHLGSVLLLCHYF